MDRNLRFLVGWTMLSATGMAVGVLAAAEAIALTVFRLDLLAALPGALALVLVMFLAGMAHGAVMGAVQSVLIRRRLGIDRTLWILTTAVAAGFAWSLSGVVSYVDQEPWDSSERITAILLGGTVLGGIVGAAQWLVLRRRIRDSIAWIPASSLSWIAGIALAVGAVEALPVNPSNGELLVFVATGMLLPGAAAGLLTGVTMLALHVPERRRQRA